METHQSENAQNNKTLLIDNQEATTQENQEQQQAIPEDKKFNKLNLPKRKYAIIHGYNGHNYSGNQK
jgi:hypothetical protein